MSTPLALIVGVGPGIGLATARRFAREGFAVALVARRAESLEGFRASVAAEGGGPVLALAADVADGGALRRALDRVQAEAGWPTVLVYNASFSAQEIPSRLKPEALLREFRVNVVAALECTHLVLPGMQARGSGSLLYTGGGLALEPKALHTGLSIGKAGLRTLALCLAEELGPEGIHAATVTVAGFVQPGTAFSPETVADAFWDLHVEPREAWRREVVLRPA